MKGWLAGAGLLALVAGCGETNGPPDATLPPGEVGTETTVMPDVIVGDEPELAPVLDPATEPAPVGTSG